MNSDKIDSFEIIKPRYSRKKIHWITSINFLVTVIIPSLLIVKMLLLRSQILGINSFWISLVAIFIFSFIFHFVEKKITYSYSVIGKVDFHENELRIHQDELLTFDYRSIKAIFISLEFVIGKGRIISINSQILTFYEGALDVHMKYESKTIKLGRFGAFFKKKKDIFDVLKERKIRYKWIRKKKNYTQQGV